MNFLEKLIAAGRFILLQGGMGIWASAWFLAREMALADEIGTVSGTAIHIVFARQLQLGDPGGHKKRAVDAFPFQEISQRIYRKYFIQGGKGVDKSFVNIEMFTFACSRELIELIILANFAEVYLAKEGHDGIVGINFLEKVQIPHLYSIYGAMLAEVDFIVVGAGVPKQFPGVIDNFMNGESSEYKIDVVGAKSGSFAMHFDPREFFGGLSLPELKRPCFIPIITSASIALRMKDQHPGKIDAFVVEGVTAAGHNSPPRIKGCFDACGNPIYGYKDGTDFGVMRSLGIPFILAGGYSNPKKVAEARQLGACGVQVGSIMALADQSGIAPNIRKMARMLAFRHELQVITSLVASPTGYAFKIARLSGTLSDSVVYENRKRICDIGLLRTPYLRADGKLGYRCSAEPMDVYVAKGGDARECEGTISLCNGLFSVVDLAQIRSNGYIEPAVLTLADDTEFVRHLMSDEDGSYSVNDVVAYLRSGI